MHVAEYALFPTRLVAAQFDAADLNAELERFFASRAEFQSGFDMHPDSFNLLDFADECPAVQRLAGMFQEGLRHWLRAEKVRGSLRVETVLFSNYAGAGDYTMPHNHNADVVAVYYVRTGDYQRPPVVLPDPDGEYDYFALEEGVLVLHDPRFNANLATVQTGDYVKVFPRPGLLVVFPGFLWHTVTPHFGDFRRLAISANFRIRWEQGARRPRTWTLRLDD
jgi:Putative 2OG-Fe(II) oxygenase